MNALITEQMSITILPKPCENLAERLVFQQSDSKYSIWLYLYSVGISSAEFGDTQKFVNRCNVKVQTEPYTVDDEK